MPSPPPDNAIETELATAIAHDQAERGDRLAALLDEVELIDRHLDLSLPPQVASYLRARHSALAEDVLRLLSQWWSVGGGIELVPPTTTSIPAADLPAPFHDLRSDDLSDDDTEEAPRPAPLGPETTAPPTATPATPAQIEFLSQHLASGHAHIDAQQPVDWRPALASVVDGLAPTPDHDADLEHLVAASRKLDQWIPFPKNIQHQLVGLVAARLRSLQDDHGYEGARINAAFSALTRFSRDQQPGFVFGLSRNQQSKGETWAADARSWWGLLSADTATPTSVEPPNRDVLLAELSRVVKELAPAPPPARLSVIAHCVRAVKSALDGGVHATDSALVREAGPLLEHLNGSAFKALRHAIREAADQAEAAADLGTLDDDDEGSELPADWPWWGRTKGRRAVLVGGVPREPNRQRIQQQLKLAELVWEDTPDKPRSVQSLRGSIQRHGVDLVIMLGAFMGHSFDNILLPACKEANVDWVHVDHGYGLSRIVQAIERFTEPLSEPLPNDSQTTTPPP